MSFKYCFFLLLLALNILSSFHALGQGNQAKEESALQRLSQDELINSCKVIVGLTDKSFRSKDYSQVVIYLHTYHHLRKNIKDSNSIKSFDEYMNKVNIRFGPYAAIVSNSGPKSNIGISENSFGPNFTSVPVNIPSSGWTHQEMNDLMHDIQKGLTADKFEDYKLQDTFLREWHQDKVNQKKLELFKEKSKLEK